MHKALYEGKIGRRAFVTGAALAGAATIAAPAAAQSGAVGQITRVQGSAFLQRSSRRLDASAGTDLLLDDFAITGQSPSRLDLRFGTKTRIRLGSDAKLHIDRLVIGAEADVGLDHGPVFIERDKGAEPDFKLRSPYALLGARGTAFFAGPSQGVFGVFVQEGMVQVRTRGGTVVVGAGFGTEIRFPGAAPRPVRAWPPARIRAALASVE